VLLLEQTRVWDEERLTAAEVVELRRKRADAGAQSFADRRDDVTTHRVSERHRE